MKVCKFGGSSLADAAQLRKVCGIVLSDPRRRIVVVSAPGKRHPDDIKVTDLLITCATRRLGDKTYADEFGDIIARFRAIQEQLGLEPKLVAAAETDLAARLDADTSERGQFMDSVMAFGEEHCARFVAAALRGLGADANYVDPGEAGMLLCGEPGDSQLLDSSYASLAAALRERPGVSVFPGFFGYTAEGRVATFPRGGSDITGAILSVAVEAEEYENFTDVDSVFAADPRIVQDERQAIPELSYREMRELAYAGFGVFHDEAVVPVIRANIPIRILNTNEPEAAGTRIVPRRHPEHGGVVGIASDSGFCCIYIDKFLMNREIGFGRRLLEIFEDEGLRYEHTPSGIDNISVVVDDTEFDEEVEARVLKRIDAELRPDAIMVERGHALIMVVGEGMQYTVGIAARATSALADAGVNIEMMNQGASEISMMFGVKSEDRHRAVRALYAAFFSKRTQEPRTS